MDQEAILLKIKAITLKTVLAAVLILMKAKTVPKEETVVLYLTKAGISRGADSVCAEFAFNRGDTANLAKWTFDTYEG